MDLSLRPWGTKDQLLFPELLHIDLEEDHARAFPKVPFVVAFSRGSHGSSADCSAPLESGFPWKTARATGWWESFIPHLEPSGSKKQSVTICHSLIKGDHLKHQPKPYSLWVSYIFVIFLTCSFISCNTRKLPRAHHQWCSSIHIVLINIAGFSFHYWKQVPPSPNVSWDNKTVNLIVAT